MRRVDLEHVIRAAAAVSGCDEIVIVGSQAILGQHPDAPGSMLFSQEADVYPRADPAKALEIDGAMGDGSQFHETFGYYAHGVGPETAKAPNGWERRLVAVRTARHGARDSDDVVGWCLEPHDLVLAKCVAGRERDWEFAREAVRHCLVDLNELLRRVVELPVQERQRESIRRMLEGLSS